MERNKDKNSSLFDASVGIWKGYHVSSDVSLFSSSLPVFQHGKLEDFDQRGRSSDDNINNIDSDDQNKDQSDDFFLPGNEDELLAGIIGDLDLDGLPKQLEDLEDFDLFDSGGGMELDYDSRESLTTSFSNMNISDGVAINGFGHHPYIGAGTVSGEHPFGEHPSRTLFVRNINSNVEDSELISLFAQYGDIRTLYTACKHRGFVMISYYDIRDARNAMRALQNKPLRRRKLDIHFSIPKDNPSEKDINQGTLVVFNLDPSVSNDDLLQKFGAYGEVKEIRETPQKRHHKFIEFYDVRHAEAALKALNRSDIAGKRIKLEPSRPGGARKNMIQHLSQELERDESQMFQNQIGSPVANSPPGNWAHIGSPIERNPLHAFSISSGRGILNPGNTNQMPGLASILPSYLSSSPKLAPIGKDQGRTSHANQIFSNGGSSPYQQSHSYTDQQLSPGSGSMSGFVESNSHSSGKTLSGPEFLWGSPSSHPDKASSSWATSSVQHPLQSSGQIHPYAGRGTSFAGTHQHHHVGSAPSGFPLGAHLGYVPESPKHSFISPIGGFNRNGNYMMDFGGNGHPVYGSPNLPMMSMPRHVFPGNGYPGLGMVSNEGFFERGRGQRMDYNGIQIDNKKQYQLDLEKIMNGEDTRTTLMIKNIPNKYTSNMLLAAIDENHRGTYDFLYLPIDFKNKCNVGYAFINMVSPSHIISFYQVFNGKRWEKFNSEKVASLAYARIQGKAALVSHFQNSSLMNEDKRCRPILFQSEGEETCNQEHLPSSNLNIYIRQPDESYTADSAGDDDEKNE